MNSDIKSRNASRQQAPYLGTRGSVLILGGARSQAAGPQVLPRGRDPSCAAWAPRDPLLPRGTGNPSGLHLAARRGGRCLTASPGRSACGGPSWPSCHALQDQVHMLTFQSQSLRDRARRFEEALRKNTEEQLEVVIPSPLPPPTRPCGSHRAHPPPPGVTSAVSPGDRTSVSIHCWSDSWPGHVPVNASLLTQGTAVGFSVGMIFLPDSTPQPLSLSWAPPRLGALRHPPPHPPAGTHPSTRWPPAVV